MFLTKRWGGGGIWSSIWELRKVSVDCPFFIISFLLLLLFGAFFWRLDIALYQVAAK